MRGKDKRIEWIRLNSKREGMKMLLEGGKERDKSVVMESSCMYIVVAISCDGPRDNNLVCIKTICSIEGIKSHYMKKKFFNMEYLK